MASQLFWNQRASRITQVPIGGSATQIMKPLMPAWWSIRIVLQSRTWCSGYRFNPEIAASISNTPLGPIGISVNGVALFNQFAGPSQPLENEIATFDRYHGHPQQTGQYHYHIEPLFFSNDDNSLVGFLLDGFPVYGQKDRDGTYPTDLDDANGHVGVTLDYSEGIYHYHITSDEPYISGGFRGTSGTVSQ
ncbi:MAG: YHYH protein [Caldithrix sp.]|nr:MAG: YHYH protein [Caldithrix sp.]